MELLEQWFDVDEMELIRSITISYEGCEDRLIWHYTKNDVYSVKTGYGVAMDLLKNGELHKKGTGVSSTCQTNCYTWKKIWHLSVPNKMKIYFGSVATIP